MHVLALKCRLEWESRKSADRATVVGLQGDLGAGKTAFVQELAKSFSIKDHITSPTYVILKRHPIEGSVFTNLIHIDAYRLKGAGELEYLGWEDLIKNAGNLICIEWAERVEDILPDDSIRMKFIFIDEKTRSVEV